MVKTSKNNPQKNPYDLDSRYLKIRGARSKHCFLGIFLLFLITTGLFWFYNHLEAIPKESPDPLVESPMTPSEVDDSLSLESEPSRLLPLGDESMGKYEFRGAWLASIHNLDYPEKSGLSSENLKASFLKILDVYQLYHLNALIMQVRPEGDALYLSHLNPPSLYVTGEKETALPFDLLKFAITETHKRGMEFHAWFNPFRVANRPVEEGTQEILDTLHPLNYARLHPDLVLRFEDQLFLNPGEPDVQNFVHQTIMEVVRTYDIDAVHLDDYAYPYPAQTTNEEGIQVPLYFGDNLEDLASFQRDSRDFLDIKAWRRDNIDQLIKTLSHDIHDLKPYVQLGISPFGIWGHQEETQGLGSPTPLSSLETYHHSVFMDTRKWVKENLVDYIIPQLYWTKDDPSAPYEELARWWNDTVEGTKVNLYLGHGLFNLYESQEETWQTGNPIMDQLSFNRTLDQVKGSAFFRFSYLVPDKKLFTGGGREKLQKNSETLKENYTPMALIPRNKNLAKGKVTAPSPVELKDNILTFCDGNEDFGENALTKAFIVYQFPKDDFNSENPTFMYKKIIVEPGIKTYHINSLASEDYTYGVSALNRLHEESDVILAIP